MSPNSKIIDIAAKTIRVSKEDAMNNCKRLPEINAYYFWNPIRGGLSVIINDDGEKLSAGSRKSFNQHYEDFINGKRN